MGERKRVSISEFACAISDFCKTQTQGTVLFFKSESEYGKLIIEGGKIVALYYNGKENEEALDALEVLSTIRYRCHPYRLSPKNRIQLSLDDFFQRIGHLDPQTSNNESSIPENEVLPVEENRADFSEALEALKEALQNALGPISGFVYEDVLDALGAPDSLGKIVELSDRLAQEIDNSEHQQQFRDETMHITMRS